MPDFEHRNPKDNRVIRAADWNGAMDAAKAYRDAKRGREGATGTGQLTIPYLDIYVVNETGANLPFGAPARLDVEAYTIDVEFGRQPAYRVKKPTGAGTDVIVLVQEPIVGYASGNEANGTGNGTGLAVLMGHAVGCVSVTDVTHPYAVSLANDSTQLHSDAVRGWRILGEVNATGNLSLGVLVDREDGLRGAWAKVTGPMANNTHPAVISTLLGNTLFWADGTTTIQLRPANIGETLATNSRYPISIASGKGCSAFGNQIVFVAAATNAWPKLGVKVSGGDTSPHVLRVKAWDAGNNTFANMTPTLNLPNCYFPDDFPLNLGQECVVFPTPDVGGEGTTRYLCYPYDRKWAGSAVTTAANYTMPANVRTVRTGLAGGDIVITLPAKPLYNTPYTIFREGLDGFGNTVVSAGLAYGNITLEKQYDSVTLINEGSYWVKVGVGGNSTPVTSSDLSDAIDSATTSLEAYADAAAAAALDSATDYADTAAAAALDAATDHADAAAANATSAANSFTTSAIGNATGALQTYADNAANTAGNTAQANAADYTNSVAGNLTTDLQSFANTAADAAADAALDLANSYTDAELGALSIDLTDLINTKSANATDYTNSSIATLANTTATNIANSAASTYACATANTASQISAATPGILANAAGNAANQISAGNFLKGAPGGNLPPYNIAIGNGPNPVVALSPSNTAGWRLTSNGNAANPSYQPDAAVFPGFNGYRLSATTDSVPATDQVGAGTLYLSPHTCEAIAIYDGSKWVLRTGSVLSLSLTGSLSNNTNYDVFAGWNGTQLYLASPVAWSGNGTRATALTKQDGVWVKAGAGNATLRFVGSIRSTGTGATEDSAAKRFVSSADNRVNRSLYKIDLTSHTYGTATNREWNNGTGGPFKTEWVTCFDDAVWMRVFTTFSAATAASIAPGLGLDWSSGGGGSLLQVLSIGNASAQRPYISDNRTVAAGYHWLVATEYASATTTFSNFEITGFVMG